MDEIEFMRELYGQANKRLMDVWSRNIRFAHYTTESTLTKIIKNKEIWLRNTSRMNDSMEIKYGVIGMEKALSINGNADRFRTFLMYVFDGDTRYVDKIVNIIPERGYIDQYITYIACLSEHHMQPDDHEDKYGRLSMWRAYGNKSGVAMLFKPEILKLEGGVIAFSPVEYWEQDEITKAVTDKINFLCHHERDIREYIRKDSNHKNAFLRVMIQMLLFAVISIKHPSFAEEKEWRLIYNPTTSDALSLANGVVDSEVVEIRGSLEKIYKIHLSDGDYKLGNLLDSIMIGPNNHPLVTKVAIEELLKKEEISSIPIVVGFVKLSV